MQGNESVQVKADVDEGNAATKFRRAGFGLGVAVTLASTDLAN